ncbi:MAG: hypothetical protein O6768_02555, partial [Planctomycetota bacterium]|nr:hypothetical protein [Planctomycetota bacterium]
DIYSGQAHRGGDPASPQVRANAIATRAERHVEELRDLVAVDLDHPDRFWRRRGEALLLGNEVTCEMITALVDQGDVDEANSSNLGRVGEAIAAAARRDLDLT